MSRPHLVSLCLLAVAIIAHAVFEDQAGQYSWHRDFVGEIRQTLFAFKGRDRAFVSTEANVVASINLRQGDIVWRQVLAAGDSIDAIALVPKPACVLSLSQQGRHLRAWHAGDGVLLWESLLGGSPSGNTALRVLQDVTGDGSSDIALLAGGKLQVRTTMCCACMRAWLTHIWSIYTWPDGEPGNETGRLWQFGQQGVERAAAGRVGIHPAGSHDRGGAGCPGSGGRTRQVPDIPCTLPRVHWLHITTNNCLA